MTVLRWWGRGGAGGSSVNFEHRHVRAIDVCVAQLAEHAAFLTSGSHTSPVLPGSRWTAIEIVPIFSTRR
jgi:hypothetical protein